MSTEPQSIIHQVLRLERNFVRALASLQKRRRRGISVLAGEDDVTNRSRGSSIEQKRAKSDEFTECSDQDSTMFSADSSRDSTASTDLSFRTLDQNEFFSDIMAAPASDEVVFVHFNIQGSRVSEAIDHQLSIESKNHPNSKFVRIDASKAPFVAKRLGTENDRPSVVALKDGKLINRISDFDSTDCLEIKQWMNTVEILKHFQQ